MKFKNSMHVYTIAKRQRSIKILFFNFQSEIINRLYAGIQHRYRFNGSSKRILAIGHSTYDFSSRVS